MRLLLLATLLLAPSITQAQNPVTFEFVESQAQDTTMVFLSQYRPTQIDTLIATVAAVDSAQQRYFAANGNFAWHPDSLATVGLKLLWNRSENTVIVLPWHVRIIELSRKDTTSRGGPWYAPQAKSQIWRVIVVFQNIMCWYPEVSFGHLPPHIDVSELPGLSCGEEIEFK